jgi:serine/threonine-protein kinase SRPK3
MELMGEFPKSVAFSGKYSHEFFSRKGEVANSTAIVVFVPDLITGELRHIQKLRYWPLDAVLADKYLFPRAEAEHIASFLTPMMRLQPDKRAPASELVHHSWIADIRVQGEVDVRRRLEALEAQKRAASAESQKRTLSGGPDVDAMKPVDAGVSDVPIVAPPTPSSARLRENILPDTGAPVASDGLPA